MITVRIVSIAYQAAKDLSTSFTCVFFCFQDDSAATFAHDEAVAVCIKRSASGFLESAFACARVDMMIGQ